MPKFKIEYEANLTKTLCSLEIRDAFVEKLQTLVQCPCNLKDFMWIHKAFVETSEEGTKVAAATGIRIARWCARRYPEPIYF